MPRTFIKNVNILTLDENSRVLEDAGLLVEDKKILALGDLPEDTTADETLDAGGKVAMPGLFNSHCHTPMLFIRGWAEDMLFPEWLQKIWVAESGLTAEDVYWVASLAAVEMIRSGTVAFNEHYFFQDKIAQVVEQSGMKAALAWCMFGEGEGTTVGPQLQQTVDWTKGMLESRNERIKVFLGPHSPYTCSKAFLEQVVGFAHDLGLGIHFHLAESREQVEESLKKYGKSPVQYSDEIGVFDVPGGCVAAHALQIDERDTEILAGKKVCIPHCPNTYMKMSMPFDSLKPRMQAGVITSLGTDGPASNSTLDMFTSIRQTALIHKFLSNDPEFLSGDQTLRMASQVGAAAMGFEDSGMIKEGMAADLILVDINAAHMQPAHDLVANLVHSSKGSDVTDMMVNGRWLMRDRELTTLDEEKILAEAGRRSARLVEEANKRVN